METINPYILRYFPFSFFVKLKARFSILGNRAHRTSIRRLFTTHSPSLTKQKVAELNMKSVRKAIDVGDVCHFLFSIGNFLLYQNLVNIFLQTLKLCPTIHQCFVLLTYCVHTCIYIGNFIRIFYDKIRIAKFFGPVGKFGFKRFYALRD